MATIKREQPNYLVIGVFLFFGISSVLIGVVFSEKLIYRIRGGYPIYIRFEELDGLTVGSKVTIGSGKNVGNVDAIDVDGAQLIVTAFIDKSIKINSDAMFQIFSTSLVGGKYLAIENFTGNMPHFEAGQTIRGIDPFSFNSIFTSLGNLFSSDDSEIKDGVGNIFSSLGDVSSQIQSLIGDNKQNIAVTITNLTDTSKYIRSISANLDRKLKGISDKEFQKLVKDLSKSVSNLNIFLEDINSPNAPLTILKDPDVNQSIRTIITNLEETTERVKAKPSLLLRS